MGSLGRWSPPVQAIDPQLAALTIFFQATGADELEEGPVRGQISWWLDLDFCLDTIALAQGKLHSSASRYKVTLH